MTLGGRRLPSAHQWFRIICPRRCTPPQSVHASAHQWFRIIYPRRCTPSRSCRPTPARTCNPVLMRPSPVLTLHVCILARRLVVRRVRQLPPCHFLVYPQRVTAFPYGRG